MKLLSFLFILLLVKPAFSQVPESFRDNLYSSLDCDAIKQLDCHQARMGIYAIRFTVTQEGNMNEMFFSDSSFKELGELLAMAVRKSVCDSAPLQEGKYIQLAYLSGVSYCIDPVAGKLIEKIPLDSFATSSIVRSEVARQLSVRLENMKSSWLEMQKMSFEPGLILLTPVYINCRERGKGKRAKMYTHRRISYTEEQEKRLAERIKQEYEKRNKDKTFVGVLENDSVVLAVDKPKMLATYSANLLKSSGIDAKFTDLSIKATSDKQYFLVFKGDTYSSSFIVTAVNSYLYAVNTISCTTSGCDPEDFGCTPKSNEAACWPCGNNGECTKIVSSVSLID
jgi:hypothetical protein